MTPEFQFRDKIAVAVSGCETEVGCQLMRDLAVHPWFEVAQGHDEPIALTFSLDGVPGKGLSIVPGVHPLVIPEVNSERIKERIHKVAGLPQPATTSLAMSLDPLSKAFGLNAVKVTTLSGPSLGPVVAKPASVLSAQLLEEVRDLFEHMPVITWSVEGLNVPVSQQIVHCISVSLSTAATVSQVREVWESDHSPMADRGLPSRKGSPLKFWHDDNPPSFDNPSERNYVHVVKLQQCPIFGFKFVVISHKRRRDALILAEWMVKAGKVFW